MNGVSPRMNRYVTPEQERRMSLVLYSFFLGFGFVGAITYPIWGYLQNQPMKLDGWVIVALLLVMATVSCRELTKTVRQPLPKIAASAGCVSVSLHYASRIGNVLEVTIEPSPGQPLPNIVFLTDNVGNTYIQCSPTVWRALNGKNANVVVTISYTGGSNFEIKLKEWGDDVEA